MKVKELIERLQKYDGNLTIGINECSLDGETVECKHAFMLMNEDKSNKEFKIGEYFVWIR